MFYKTIHKTWNLFKLSEQSPKRISFMSFDWLRIPFDWSNALFDWSNKNRASIEIGRDSRIDFLTILIDQAKPLIDQK